MGQQKYIFYLFVFNLKMLSFMVHTIIIIIKGLSIYNETEDNLMQPVQQLLVFR